MGKFRKQHLTITGTLGATAVIIGAFGAHALKPHLSEYGLGIYETGVTYHFYHSLAIGIASIFYSLYKKIWFHRAVLAFALGTFLFSGSLYLLALKEIMNLEFGAFIGPLTPIGGVILIAAWIFLIIGGYAQNKVIK